MKNVLYLCFVPLVVFVRTASAAPGNGIDLTWDNCVTETTQPPPANDKEFPCDGAQTHKLIGCFKVGTSMREFFALDIAIHLRQADGEPLVPFYHYEIGGCNSNGIALFDAKNLTPCTALFATPWGPAGEEPVFTGITAYGPNYVGQNGFGILLASIARASDNPIDLVAGTNYYGFHLEFYDFNAAPSGACAGCNTPASVVWNSATLFGNREARVLQLPDKQKTYCATINHGVSTCFAVPARNTTWGQLKSIYR